jgi:hypothetical protein
VNLSGDIPERNVDTRHGGGANHAGAMPEVLAEHHLPQVLDTPRVLTDQENRDVLQRADHRARMPFEGCLAPADQARRIGFHLDEHPVAHARIANQRFDRRYLH